MIQNGDVFITKLERGFYGAFRVLKAGIIFDFSKNEFYLLAITSFIDASKPDITDNRLKEVLCEERFSYGGKPNINIYSGQIIESHFEYLGNIPLSEAEAKLPAEIGDGTGSGFPLAGAVQKDFGEAAFLEWRWRHERDVVLQERQEFEAQRAALTRQHKEQILQSCAESTSKAYRYKDDKSDKFWRIEYADLALAVNYGKTGTIGRYKLKEFSSEQECGKEVQKLIATKLKKGYQPCAEFALDKHLYFDDEEVGLHPLTSHPRFRAHFMESFYYDCSDEEAPFGSDEGADALYIITEKLRKNPSLDFAKLPRCIIEDEWGMKYILADSLSEEAVADLLEADETDTTQSDMTTYAVAFGQIKTTGMLDPALKENALKAMKRFKIAAKILGWSENSEELDKMINDLSAFV